MNQIQTTPKSQKMVIYKFPIKPELVLPKGAQILSVQHQHGELQMWYLIPTSSLSSLDTELRLFASFGTGQQFFWTPNLRYITTVQEADGTLIWHIFEVKMIPMYYKMPVQGLRPELAKLYPKGTNTAILCRDGYRCATTRCPFGKAGDLIQIQGCAGMTFRIVAVVPIDLDTEAGREEWSKREGWDAAYARQMHGGQVHTGAMQTIFEKV